MGQGEGAPTMGAAEVTDAQVRAKLLRLLSPSYGGERSTRMVKIMAGGEEAFDRVVKPMLKAGELVARRCQGERIGLPAKRRQRGDMQIALIAALAAALMAAGAYLLGHWQGVAAGEAKERLAWQTREAEELRAANAALAAAQARAADLERQAAADLAALDAAHLKKEKALEASHDRFLDDLAAGRIRLFNAATACQGARGSAPGAPPASAGVDARAGEPDVRGALQQAVAGGAELAAEADRIAEALTGLQAYYRTVVVPTCR